MHARGQLCRVWWWICWFAYGVLLVQQAADAFSHGAPWIIWLAKLFPLLLFLPGMLRDRLRSYVWLCFVSLLYFIALVERVFAQPGEAPGIIGLVSVVILFISAMLYVRWRGPELRAG